MWVNVSNLSLSPPARWSQNSVQHILTTTKAHTNQSRDWDAKTDLLIIFPHWYAGFVLPVCLSCTLNDLYLYWVAGGHVNNWKICLYFLAPLRKLHIIYCHLSIFLVCTIYNEIYIILYIFFFYPCFHNVYK